MPGYCGKIARIDLSSRTVKIEFPDEKIYRKFWGGKGFCSYYLLKELPPGIDPLGEENKLVFAAGILTGVPVSGMSRLIIAAKSPLTGGYGQSEAGGYWGPELKKAGYDALIVEGKASSPVYIAIRDKEIGILPADHLWGKDTGECQDTIRRELGDEFIRVAAIGRGGENLVRYAAIVNELKHANGRTGLGAVMGSKNLKAVAVRGTAKLSFANEDKILEIAKTTAANVMVHPMSRALNEFGTPGLVMAQNAGGILPTNNFINGEFGDAEKLGVDELDKTLLKEKGGCYACAIRCKRVVEYNGDDFSVAARYGGPEYETIGAFGSLCGIANLPMIAKAHELCNRYTLDTISAGATIALAMECFEKGILTKDDTDGLELTFGNWPAALELIEKIATRTGFGNLLAEGSARLAQKLGPEAEKMAMQVKKQELPMHDPRGKVGVALNYALSETGAEHMLAAHDPLYSQKGIILDSLAPLGIHDPLDTRDFSFRKVRAFVYLQQWWSFLNMAGACFFGPAPRGLIPIMEVIALVKACTGWDTSLWETMKAGERADNLTRLFNLREGFTAEDDTLPERLFEPLRNGKLRGVAIDRKDFGEALALYYQMAGWSADGVPTKGKLYELGLEDYAI